MADLSALSAAFEAHKVPILAAAAAGTAGLAYYRKKHPTAPAGPAQGVSTASAGGQTAGMNGAAAYDSSASDVYGLVQPQLESLGNQLSTLADRMNSVPVAAAPTPAPAPAVGTILNGGAGGDPASIPTPVPGIPDAPAWYPNRPAFLGPLNNPVTDPAMHSVTGYIGQSTYGGNPDGGTFSPSGYTAPTGQPNVGAKLLDANGNVAATLTSYTFNGFPQYSDINMNTFDAAKKLGRYA